MKRNIFLVFNGLQTIAVGVFLLFQQHTLMDDDNDRIVHYVHYMGGPAWATFLVIIGLLSLIIGLLNTNKFHFQQIIIVLLGGVWFAYSTFFIINDWHFCQPVHLGTVLSAFVFIQILFEAWYGGRS